MLNSWLGSLVYIPKRIIMKYCIGVLRKSWLIWNKALNYGPEWIKDKIAKYIFVKEKHPGMGCSTPTFEDHLFLKAIEQNEKEERLQKLRQRGEIRGGPLGDTPMIQRFHYENFTSDVKSYIYEDNFPMTRIIEHMMYFCDLGEILAFEENNLGLSKNSIFYGEGDANLITMANRSNMELRGRKPIWSIERLFKGLLEKLL
ncbi:hypothetical protein ACOME3_004464 [Neoechinorhynchus agilis]